MSKYICKLEYLKCRFELEKALANSEIGKVYRFVLFICQKVPNHLAIFGLGQEIYYKYYSHA